MDDRVAALLELLFRAPGEMTGWWPFFEALGRAISPGVCVSMVVEDAPPRTTTSLFCVRAQHTAEGLLPLRPKQRERLAETPLGVVLEVPRFRRQLSESPVLQGLLAPEGLEPGPGLGVLVHRDPDRNVAALLVLPCKPGWEPSGADRELLAAIAPCLPHATRLHMQLLGGSAMTTLLDQLVLGVILLDEQGRVSYTNRSGAELIGGEPGFVPPEQRERGNDRLYRTVQGADRSLHRHPLNGRPLQLLATPIAWPNRSGFPARQFARAVFIGDPQRNTGDPIENLGQAYGLTPAETRLAWLLVGDRTLAEAAAQLRITESTARTVLKRVLAKTGTRRQASLVRLLLSGPAQLRADAQRVTVEPPWNPRPRRR